MSRTSYTADDELVDWFKSFKLEGENNDEYLQRVCSVLEQRLEGEVPEPESTGCDSEKIHEEIQDARREITNRLDDLENELPRKTAAELRN